MLLPLCSRGHKERQREREGSMQHNRSNASQHGHFNDSAKIDVQKLYIEMKKACAAAS